MSSKTVEEAFEQMIDKRKMEQRKAIEAAFEEWAAEATCMQPQTRHIPREIVWTAFTAGAAHGAAERGSYDDGYDDGLSEGKRIGAAEERWLSDTEWQLILAALARDISGLAYKERQTVLFEKIEARIRQRGEK